MLCLTSRLKGLVIINGCNHHPADVAATAERAVPVARPSHVAAFAVHAPDGKGPALIIEVKPAHVWRFAADSAPWQGAGGARPDPRGRTTRGRVVRPEVISRAVSGKLRRRACRQRHPAGGLKRLPNLPGETHAG
ncbi:hypothetical protein D7147_22860 [Micromonospora musae]|uniref:Uncharacterized protein n=1 Tax=Micromonospora musae TaxID=1894970 RepID=A0A3A9Y3K6_9ACTN|nr:hypothetical protein [Micromonospora musae]RKN16602.1 hypothetical protein D7147_22860 [Micromonospora musae]RKN26166.1 hypothetical protein D7044_30490 [Micromonospora musae]